MWRAENLVVFVGEKLSVVERPSDEDPEVLTLDAGFDASYRVLEVVYGRHDEATIDFVAWDHYGRPEFAEYDTVLLYVARDDQGFVHHKYIFQPVYSTQGGGWSGCGDPYQGMPEEHRVVVEAVPARFAPEVRFDTAGLPPSEVADRYPPEFFEYRDGVAICRAGASVEGLFEVMREGYLAVRGVFGRWKQLRAWRRFNT